MNTDCIQSLHPPAVRRISLALTLLIVLLPVLSATQALAMGCQPDANRTAQGTPPCHEANDPVPRAMPPGSAESGCPHCNSDATASHCPCPDPLVPTSTSGSPELATADTPSDGLLRCVLASGLPESPGENRFRPPIHLLS